MNKSKLKSFLATNAIDYSSLDYSGENEIDQDASHKAKWLKQGKSALKELADNITATALIDINRSGSIDRGYVTAFFSKNDKVAYIKLSDGMQDILFRTAEHTKDYTGGSNHTETIDDSGWDRLTEWVQDYLG